jgi:hypothetical protein
MPLIHIDDGSPDSDEYSSNYRWVDPDHLDELLRNLGNRTARVILLPPEKERRYALAEAAPSPRLTHQQIGEPGCDGGEQTEQQDRDHHAQGEGEHAA